MSLDPLSDVLSLLKLRSYSSGGFDVGGDWSVQFGQHDGVKVYAVLTGGCWLAVEGVAEPVWAKAGDCFLLPLGRPFRIASDLSLTPVDGLTLIRRQPGELATINGGGTFVAGGHFALAAENAADLLLQALPPIVHIRSEADRAQMRWSLEMMRQELREPRPGGVLVAEHLAQMMLVQALRLHLAEGPGTSVGWLFALADRQMGSAIGAVHAEPQRRWTLQELAEVAGMSRSSFAAKFKAAVGIAPMEYVTRWRMVLAADRLASSAEPVGAIALSLGYESESAFSTAFKRIKGVSPRQFARRRAEAVRAPNPEPLVSAA